MAHFCAVRGIASRGQIDVAGIVRVPGIEPRGLARAVDGSAGVHGGFRGYFLTLCEACGTGD